jgi:tRNA threonylcarbamoyladenosine biosynthesis protein TsaE
MMTHLADTTATLAWGHALAAELRPGDVIALCGPLGAGKTHVTKGLLHGLGSAAEVTSPTFTLVHEYRDGRLPVFHFDLYRMERAEEVLAIGWDDYLDEPGVVIVEWADLFPELLPEHTRWYRLAMAEDGGRVIEAGL